MTATWALITVTYNSSKDLRQFWSDTDFSSDITWVVVDNNSSDDSAEVARALGARVIELPVNIGFGSANNVGHRATESKYVGYINPDVRVRAGDLAGLAEVIDATRGLVSPQLTDPNGDLQPNGRGYPYLLEKVRNRLERSSTQSGYRLLAASNEELPVIWFMGAAVLGDRAQLSVLGPWDERFFVYYEDSDLGLRARAAGMPSTISGRHRWVHGWARETAKPSLKAWKLEIPSMIKFYSRYPKLLGWPGANKREVSR